MQPEQPEPGAKTGAAAETVSIVRYPNRRLYDRTQARYVTLREIAQMVREGKTISVRDHKSNDDLTSTILTQIILEHHPERMDLLPVPMLHLMIRSNDIVLSLLRDYFRQALMYVDFCQHVATFNPMAASLEWLKSILPASASGRESTPAEGLPKRTAAVDTPGDVSGQAEAVPEHGRSRSRNRPGRDRGKS